MELGRGLYHTMKMGWEGGRKSLLGTVDIEGVTRIHPFPFGKSYVVSYLPTALLIFSILYFKLAT